MLSWDTIETGFDQFLALLQEDERARGEFERSRGEFFGAAEGLRSAGADLRYLEWFLLERPSPALGGIPAQAWQGEWRARLPAHASELSAAFLQSLPGAFEVTSVVPGEGLWLRDLFTLGEHPVAEARATSAIQVGDLLVGRLYPGGGGVFLLSPSVSSFRNPALLEAVRADLARMRSVRRGVLRVQQLELERLFHGSAPLGTPDPTEVRARLRAELEALGLETREVERVLERVRRAARSSDGREVTEILNALAFDTGIDLSSARLLLVELWDLERHGVRVAGEGGAEAGVDASEALAAFDRGRAEGQDLEKLFQRLEQDLGVEDEDQGDEEEAGAPDFPGVIGAMVDEFLWEVERERGPALARSWALLRHLGTYGGDIGVFEELGNARLLDFSGRWVLDESGLQRAEEVTTLLAALEAFCAWCEEQQDLPLLRSFGPTLERLRASVPRHLRLRRACSAGPGAGTFRVLSVAGTCARASDRTGRELEVELTPEQAEHLREGDLVRLVRKGKRRLLGASYPAELAEALF